MATERIYRRTDAGRQALASGNIGIVGGEYRRILDLVSGDTHFDGVRAALPHYADAVISRWLRELESRGLLESCAGAVEQDLDFTGSFKLAELLGKNRAQ
jgi:hypothetical protein